VVVTIGVPITKDVAAGDGLEVGLVTMNLKDHDLAKEIFQSMINELN
jgi:hypothetical protein